TVDHGWLHLEARYNDEALQTASVWVGWNLAWGEELTLSLTPMVGAIFGKENGIAPGLEWSLAWGPLELSSENEFVIDLGNLEQSYFYAWSELNVRPFPWLHAGVALQRTKVHTDRHGLLRSVTSNGRLRSFPGSFWRPIVRRIRSSRRTGSRDARRGG